MLTRKLGSSELDFTTIGLGTWAIGGPWQYGWGPQDDEDSIETIIVSLEEGINWIDTAAIYGCGHSEFVVGRALKKFGGRVMVATKCGLVWNDKREKVNCLDHDSIIRECEDSLRRLGVEVIDLYQMHWPEPDEQIEEAWQAMIELRDQGKVRYIGVSNFSVEQLERISAIEKPASIQPPYSMLARDIESDILPYCGENNIGVVAYSPMKCGLLTGKYTPQKVANLPDDDFRKGAPDFNEPKLSVNLEFVEKLQPIAEGLELTHAQLALAWVIARKEVTSAIAGARHPQQIKETVKAGGVKLEADILDEIENLIYEREERLASVVDG